MAETLHAHRCVACAAKGEQVIWIHGEKCKGVLQAHTCPKCGSSEKENWRRFMVEPGKLPEQNAGKSTANFETILGYTVLLIGLALIGYGIYVYIQQRREGKASGPNVA